jgi:hypothetical protein
MQGFESLGKWLVVIGAILLVVGGLIWLAGRIPGLKQIPGTLQINLGGLTCIIPILASIVLSVILTLLINLALRLWRH